MPGSIGGIGFLGSTSTLAILAALAWYWARRNRAHLAGGS